MLFGGHEHTSAQVPRRGAGQPQSDLISSDVCPFAKQSRSYSGAKALGISSIQIDEERQPLSGDMLDVILHEERIAD
ncbi:hypothetical protein CK215_27925 [Mesorhizobium sp. WSM3864]|nr:hypothetical protein CK215_27925 [Mesorhizobium sp. WSM3864]